MLYFAYILVNIPIIPCGTAVPIIRIIDPAKTMPRPANRPPNVARKYSHKGMITAAPINGPKRVPFTRNRYKHKNYGIIK